jgi:PKD repeat protein
VTGSPPVTGSPVSHTFATAGSFTVTVTVTDDHGKSGTATAVVRAV